MSAADLHPFARLMKSPGYAFSSRLKGLLFSVNLLSGNFRSLMKVCQVIEHPEKGAALMTAGMEKLVPVHMEANRQLHNFVASAFTLVEHTRNFMRRHYAGTDLLARYEEKVRSDFVGDGLAQFIQGLRNFFCHNDLPNNKMSMKLALGKPTTTSISLNRDDLMAWSGWNKAARSYLEASC